MTEFYNVTGESRSKPIITRMPYLETVDELSQRDVLTVSEDVYGAELFVSAVPKFEPQELAGVRRRSAAKLDGDGRAVVSCIVIEYGFFLLI